MIKGRQRHNNFVPIWAIACGYILLISIGENLIGRVNPESESVVGIARYEKSAYIRSIWVVACIIITSFIVLWADLRRRRLIQQLISNLGHPVFIMLCGYSASGIITLFLNEVSLRDWYYWLFQTYSLFLLFLITPREENSKEKLLKILACLWFGVNAFGILIDPNILKTAGGLRLGGSMGSPSALGLTLSIIFVLCLAHSGMIRLLLCLASFSLVILTGSRTGFFSALSGFLTWVLISSIKLSFRRKLLIWVTLGTVLVLLTLPYLKPIFKKFGEGFLALEDERRGISSGFTGRTEAWRKSSLFWHEKPYFGWGPNANTRLLYPTSSHSSFWAKMVDRGSVGTGLVVMMFFAAFVLHIRHARTRSSAIFIAVIMTAGIQAFTEDILLLAGSSSSVFISLCTFALPYQVEDEAVHVVCLERHCSEGI